MTVKDFSDNFDIGLVSYLRFKKFDDKEYLDSIEINEYEKSLYLTKAQNDITLELYSGRNYLGESYEQTEELRRYLNNLNSSETITQFQNSGNIGIDSKSKICTLSGKVLVITFESCYVTVTDPCYVKKWIECIPVRRDEYNIIRNNPFKNNKVLRVDHSGNMIELITNHQLIEYKVNYLKYPGPIILEDIYPYEIEGVTTINESSLPTILHDQILERAIQYAVNDIASKSPQQDN